MIRLAWIVHNNASNMARLLIDGMRELGSDVEHSASREDILGLREPHIEAGTPSDSIGNFPDHGGFVPELASEGFWEKLPSADFICLTLNAGRNHNAYHAAEIIRSHNLFHKLVYVDESETGFLHPDFRDMFLKAKLSFVWRPRLNKMFEVHPHVINFGFSGIERRYLKFLRPYEKKDLSVFFRGRLAARSNRLPFLEALKARAFPDSAIMPELKQNEAEEDLRLQFVTGNRHNVSYLQYLARSKVSVTLHGGNPVGYQFWEANALKCAQLVQSPKKTEWYEGGSYPTDKTDYEQWEPPFVPGKHFLTFESPHELIELADHLLSHDETRETMAKEAHEFAITHYSTRARAEKFMTYLLRNP